MRVIVCELDSGAETNDVDVPFAQPDCNWESVLYGPVSRLTPPSDLEPLLKRVPSNVRRSVAACVLRLHKPEAAALLSKPRVAHDIGRRLEGVPTYVLHHADGDYRLEHLAGESSDCGSLDELLRALRHADLAQILRRPGVLLPKLDEFHYEGPSGRHYSSYIRIGMGLHSIETLDGLAFWLLPYLRDVQVVVLDSRTVISLGLNLERYARDCGLSDIRVLGVECQRAYDEQPEDIERRLTALYQRATGSGLNPPPALLLGSVSSTGRLMDRLEDVVKEVGFTDTLRVSLFAPGDAVGHVFCEHADLGTYWEAAKCPLQSPTVPIASSTYLLELSAAVEGTRIRLPNARQSWDFFDRYSGTNCVAIHRQQHDSERHHMVHIDLQRIVRTKSFSERLDTTLQELGGAEIGVVLSPRHGAATDLAEMVSTRLGIDRVVADEAELPRLSGDEERLLRDARRILLVDDVVITGTRLRGYRYYLRRAGYMQTLDPNGLHLLVGIARADDNDQLRGIADMVHHVAGAERFHPVESLLMPNWDESDCPWCWELNSLNSVMDEVAQDELMALRWDRLKNTAYGLDDELFLPWGAAPEQLREPQWSLGPGSIFHAKSQAELFAAVASALQSLRAAGDLNERFTTPIARILEKESWLTGRYYDPVITASILRATRRHDLRAAAAEDDQRRALSRRLSEPASRELRGEVLMAMARGHLPIVDEALGQHGLEDPTGRRGLRTFLASALQSS